MYSFFNYESIIYFLKRFSIFYSISNLLTFYSNNYLDKLKINDNKLLNFSFFLKTV